MRSSFASRTSLSSREMRAESSEEIAGKLRLGWPQVAREIAGGLAALHAMDLAHLSLHPGNVMLDGQTRVKLADYALPTELICKRRELLAAMNEPLEAIAEEHQLYEAPEVLRAEVGLLVGLLRPPVLPANSPQLARSVDTTGLSGTHDNACVIREHSAQPCMS